MTPTVVIIGALALLLAGSVATSYLIYVRIRHLERERRRLRANAEVGDDELKQIESSIRSMDM